MVISFALSFKGRHFWKLLKLPNCHTDPQFGVLDRLDVSGQNWILYCLVTRQKWYPASRLRYMGNQIDSRILGLLLKSAKGALEWCLLHMTHAETVTLPPLQGTSAQTPSEYQRGGHPEIPRLGSGYPQVPHNTLLRWIL